MAELKITLTEQDLAKLPKSISVALLEYLQLPNNISTEAGTVPFEYAPEWMQISYGHRHRKLVVVSLDEAYEFSRMLFDEELPVFRKFFQNDSSCDHNEQVEIFNDLGNWGAFGTLAFLCGLDGPRKIAASTSFNKMAQDMQSYGLNSRYDGKSLSPLLKRVRYRLNEFYQKTDTFHLYATTNTVSRAVKPHAFVFATGTREAFNEALTKTACG